MHRRAAILQAVPGALLRAREGRRPRAPRHPRPAGCSAGRAPARCTLDLLLVDAAEVGYRLYDAASTWGQGPLALLSTAAGHAASSGLALTALAAGAVAFSGREEAATRNGAVRLAQGAGGGSGGGWGQGRGGGDGSDEESDGDGEEDHAAVRVDVRLVFVICTAFTAAALLRASMVRTRALSVLFIFLQPLPCLDSFARLCPLTAC